MNSAMKGIYRYLPGCLKNVVASIRGYRLQSLRYDARTKERIKEAHAREKWEQSEWEEWEKRKIEQMLEFVATKVPYYRRYWKKRAPATANVWRNLREWPILEKNDLREHADEFIAEGYKKRGMISLQTSGTTGSPLKLWRSKEAELAWYALAEARWRQWHGVTRDNRWGIFGGQLVIPSTQKKPPFWVWNGAMKQLYLSSYHLSPENIGRYLEAIKKYQIKYIYGYTSSLLTVAKEIIRKKNQADFQLQVIVLNAEPVSEIQREIIREAFKCPVKETYGMTEIVAAAGECESGQLHLWPEVGIVEVVEGRKPVERGQIGDFVCTGLINRGMPLIRYRVGDRGALAPKEAERCSCGRTLPILKRVEGRCDDIILTPSGARVGRLDPVFKKELPLREAQIIQTSLEEITVKYVPEENFNENSRIEIANELKKRLEGMKINFEQVSQINRTKNGKFKAVISHVLDREGKS